MTNLKQKSIDAIIWNLIERYGIQAFSLIIGIILARLLTPADYGLIGMITVFYTLSRVFVDSGFGSAYIQKKNVTENDASTIFFFNVFVSIFFYILLWFSAPFIANFFEQPQLINLIRVSAIVLVINAVSMIQVRMLTKEVNFKKKSLISLISTIISGILGITAALNDYGVWSLVIQQIANSFVFTIGLWFFYSWKPKMIFHIASLRSMLSFSTWILLTNLIVTFFDNIYLLVIGKYFPVAQLGFYTKAKGYQKIVTQQPVSAINVVSFPVFSKLQDNKPALKSSMKKFTQHTLFFIAPVVAIMMVIAKPLFLVVLTEKWLPMVPYFQVLLVVGLLFPIHLMNVQLLNAQGKTNINFKLSLLKNALRIINIFIMFRFGVIYIIYGELIVSFLALFINGFYTKKMIDYGMLEQLRDIALIFFITAIVILLGYFITSKFGNYFLQIGLGLLITGGSYFVLNYFFNKTFLLDNLSMIKNKLKINKS